MQGSIWHILIGYVTISIKGLSLERFLNELHRRGVVLYEVKRISRQEVRLRVTRRHHWLIKKALNEGGYDCRVVKTFGLSYFTERMLLRPVLLVGLVLCIGGLFWAGDFVMKVDYQGIMSDEVRLSVMAATEEVGIVPGAYKAEWDRKALSMAILKKVPELCFVSIIERGMDVTIEAIEGKPIPESQKRNEPSNVVAAKDCMIHKMSVLNGTPVVEIGQTVRRGSLLISGVVQTKNDKTYLTGAMGNIEGRVWYQSRRKRTLYHVLHTPTGESTKVYSYAFGDNIFIKGKESPYDEYEVDEREYMLLPGILPFSVTIHEYREIKSQVVPLDEDEVQVLAEAEAMEAAMAKVPEDATIVDQNVVSTIVEGHVIADAYVETLEEVAISVPLG